MAKKLADVIDEADKEAGYSDTVYFKIKEGDNKIRILTFPERQVLHWDQATKKYYPVIKGDKMEGITIKWLMWVIDRDEKEDAQKVKLAKLPHTVMKLIQAFQDDEDYAFEDFPMPYDIKITAKNAGKTEVKYAVIPSPKRSEIDEPTLAELLDGKRQCSEIVASQKERRMQEVSADASFEKGSASAQETEVEEPAGDEDY